MIAQARHLIVLPLLIFTAFLDAASQPENVEIIKLGTGSVKWKSSAMEPRGISLNLGCTLKNVASILVEAPEMSQPLLRVVATPADSTTPGGEPQALSTIAVDTADLSGLDVKQTLGYAIPAIKVLQLTVTLRDGVSVPMTFRSTDLRDGEFVITLDGSGCHTTTVTCAYAGPSCPACSQSIECCGRKLDDCFGCPNCKVACAPCYGWPPDSCN